MEEQKKDPSFIGFAIICHTQMVDEHLSKCKSFYDDIESLFVSKDSNLQEKISEELKEIPEKFHQDHVEGYGLELHENQSLFPTMHRESTFLTIYNYIENGLNTHCHYVSELEESKVKLSDLKHKGIERVLLYLKKVALLNFETMNNEISFIKNCNSIRNIIVHSGSMLPQNEQEKINKFISSQEKLSGNPGERVSIEEGFIHDYIEVLVSFFKKLEKETIVFVNKYT